MSMRDRELDGLRGFAAIGVVIFHARYGAAFAWMWTLVDLFFVLSGFVITRIILDGLSTGGFSFRNFMIRRVLRIWPVYYSVLLLCLSYLFLKFLVSGAWPDVTGLKSAPLFLQFTHHYLAAGLNAGEENFIPWFHHSWSIAVEEQFYLLMPLLLVLFRRQLNYAVYLIAALVPLAVFFRYQEAYPWLLVSRMDALALGALLAFYWRYLQGGDMPRLRIRPAYVALLGAVALYMAMSLYFGLWIPVAWRYPLSLLGFNLLYACVILCLLSQWLPWLGRIFRSRVMLFLGAISYALYMIHLPVRGVILSLTDGDLISNEPLYIQIGYFGLSILAAWLSKVILEDRVNRLKHKFPVKLSSETAAGQEAVAR